VAKIAQSQPDVEIGLNPRAWIGALSIKDDMLQRDINVLSITTTRSKQLSVRKAIRT